MPTDKQIEASRRNGAKSRGPVTAEGKANSSRNAIKHGLLSKAILLKGESEEGFLELAETLFTEFEPATAFEESLVESMVVARWRQERMWHYENATMERQINLERDQSPVARDYKELAAAACGTLADNSRAMDLIIRHESRLERQYLRAHKRLVECQNARRKSGPPSQPSPSRPGPKVVPIDSAPPVDPAPAATPEPAPIDTLEVAKRTQQPVANKHVVVGRSFIGVYPCASVAQNVLRF